MGRRLTLPVGRLTVLHMHVVTIVVLHEVTLVLRLWSWYVKALVLAIIDLTLVSRALVAIHRSEN